MGGCTLRATQFMRSDFVLSKRHGWAVRPRRYFHDYFVTHLPSSSLHPDSRSSTGAHHQLPRSASKPHTPQSSRDPSPAPIPGVTRDTTVVRIPLRSAKHHFGVSVSRGTRPYNEDSYQAGVIELPAFAKRAPVSLTRAPASSPLQAFREGQRKQREQQGSQQGDGEGTSAESASGDPQVFYFGVFDGHGGAECSGFLRESLHEYIEDAGDKFELVSSLKGSEEQTRKGNPKSPTGEEQVDRDTGWLAAAGRESLDSIRMKESFASDPSSTKLEENQVKGVPTAKEDPKPPIAGSPPLSQDANTSRVTDLEGSLIKSWCNTVGGYFRRFRPAALTISQGSDVSISTVLTYAFLRADLDFISAQAHKTDADLDLTLSDAPLNASDIFDSPSYQIGGPKRFKGGSTCSLALISTPTPAPFWHPASPSTLIVAHVGDTRIMLCNTSDGTAMPVTTNHHPSSPGEGERLRKYAASFVTDSFGEERMSGLANTRAFGDMQSKRLGVSAEPEIRRVELAPAKYSFMVLISDGVSGTLSDQEVVDIVKEAKTPERGAKDVVSFATEVSREGDNATCLVIRLGGWERRSEGGGGSMGTKETREWRKQDATDPRSRMT